MTTTRDFSSKATYLFLLDLDIVDVPVVVCDRATTTIEVVVAVVIHKGRLRPNECEASGRG